MKIEKLELKHLAAYLPYKLKIDLSDTEYGQIEKDRLTDCELIGLKNENIFLKTNIETQNRGNLVLWIDIIKPLLLPLEKAENILIECAKLEFEIKSILRFEISKHNIFGYNISILFKDKFDEQIDVIYYEKLNCFVFDNYSTHTYFNICIENVKMIEKFLENQVDIFNLILNNLAIDKTTLKY